MTYLLSIATDALKNDSFAWLLVASLLPLGYLLKKKRKQGLLQKVLTKWITKRAQKRVNKGKELSNGLVILLILLGIIGICALLVWLLGGTWAVIIGLLLVIGVAGAVRKD